MQHSREPEARHEEACSLAGGSAKTFITSSAKASSVCSSVPCLLLYTVLSAIISFFAECKKSLLI